MSDSEKIIRDRQSELALIIESIDEVLKCKGWQTLKELVFDKETDRVERLLLAEAKSSEPNLKTLYKLQGEFGKIKHFDLKSYAEKLVKELQGIKDNKNESSNAS